MGNFIRHYIEMVLAMFAGMFVYGQTKGFLVPILGMGSRGDRAEVQAVTAVATSSSSTGMLNSSLWSEIYGIALMDVAMIIPMVLWMRFRAHSWRHGAEMSAAMVLPSIPVYAVGFIWPDISDQLIMVSSHGVMLLGMLILMVVQRGMYSDHPHPLPNASIKPYVGVKETGADGARPGAVHH